MPLKDLTGQKFGRLTVINRIENDKNHQARWECICECGNKVIARTYSLTSGHTQSCGCSRVKDLIGQRFGRLLVLERAENKGKQTAWKCRCDCGAEVIVQANSLNSGQSKSCGCLHSEIIKKTHITHGKSRPKLYYIWRGIKVRCLNESDAFFSSYGGRGISMHPEWIDNFQDFYDYVSKLPHFGEEGYSLDRINNNGNYEPNNLRWATSSEQQRNTRQNHFVDFKGEKITIAEAAERSGISESALRSRIKRGDTADRLFRPVVQRQKHHD